MSNLVTYFAHIYRIIVTFAVCVQVGVRWIFPCLQVNKLKFYSEIPLMSRGFTNRTWKKISTTEWNVLFFCFCARASSFYLLFKAHTKQGTDPELMQICLILKWENAPPPPKKKPRWLFSLEFDFNSDETAVMGNEKRSKKCDYHYPSKTHTQKKSYY